MAYRGEGFILQIEPVFPGFAEAETEMEAALSAAFEIATLGGDAGSGAVLDDGFDTYHAVEQTEDGAAINDSFDATLQVETLVNTNVAIDDAFDAPSPSEDATEEGVSVDDDFVPYLLSGSLAEGTEYDDTFESWVLSGNPQDDVVLDDAFEAFHLVDLFAEGIGSNDSFERNIEAERSAAEGITSNDQWEATALAGHITGNAGIGASLNGFTLDDVFQDQFTLQDSFVPEFLAERSFGDVFAVNTDFDGFNLTRFLHTYAERCAIRYYFTLTGVADGVDNIEIPISSFQARSRNGDPSYLSVVVPGTGYASAIAARPNGEMIIEMGYVYGGETMLREEILRVDFEDVNLYEGSQNQSIILTGHKTETFIAKTVTLQNATYRNTYQGRTTYRTVTPDIYLKPGDTVEYGSDSFIADLITFSVGESQQVMEVEGE